MFTSCYDLPLCEPLDRTGDLAKLSVKFSEGNNDEQTASSLERPLKMNNPKIMFNKDSDLIVGGVSMAMRLPPQVSPTNYTGCVDALQVNHHFVGTWNSEVSKVFQVPNCH